MNPSQPAGREACSQGRPIDEQACSQGRPIDEQACSQGRPIDEQACSQGRPIEPDPATADGQKATGVFPRPRRTGLLAAAAGVTLVLDVLTKIIAVTALEGHPPVKLLGGALYLVVYRNPGAAFSLATGLTWVLSLIAVAVAVAIIRLAPRLRSAGWAFGLGLVLGGALGNLVDRLLRAPGPLRGHVVDFLSLLAPDGSVWPVFNLADSAIVCGGALLVYLAATGREFDGSRSVRRQEAGNE